MVNFKLYYYNPGWGWVEIIRIEANSVLVINYQLHFYEDQCNACVHDDKISACACLLFMHVCSVLFLQFGGLHKIGFDLGDSFHQTACL